MKYEVIEKTEPVPEPRTGELAALYRDLVALMESAPSKKMVVDFETKTKGYRAQCKLLAWAAEDHLTLFASAIVNTAKREMYLQKEEA